MAGIDLIQTQGNIRLNHEDEKGVGLCIVIEEESAKVSSDQFKVSDQEVVMKDVIIFIWIFLVFLL